VVKSTIEPVECPEYWSFRAPNALRENDFVRTTLAESVQKPWYVGRLVFTVRIHHDNHSVRQMLPYQGQTDRDCALMPQISPKPYNRNTGNTLLVERSDVRWGWISRPVVDKNDTRSESRITEGVANRGQ
jgi:hypothetical protein